MKKIKFIILSYQALASLLNKRTGGVEKEKDLFELPALPKKVRQFNKL